MVHMTQMTFNLITPLRVHTCAGNGYIQGKRHFCHSPPKRPMKSKVPCDRPCRGQWGGGAVPIWELDRQSDEHR